VIAQDPAYGEVSLFFDNQAEHNEHIKRIGQLEEEHKDLRKDNPEEWRGAIAAKKMFAMTDGRKFKISAKGMRKESRYLDEEKGAELAFRMKSVRKRLGTLGKARYKLPPMVTDPQLEAEYEAVADTWDSYQRQLRDFYEDFERVSVDVRRMDFVDKLEALVAGETKTIYGVTMSFNRIRNLARRGSSMAVVADHHDNICRIEPVYAIKKITLKKAEWGAFFADGQGLEEEDEEE
jgi:hypothetical protein